MPDLDRPRFICNAAVTFDLFGLPAWVRAEQAAGRIASGAVELEVLHPERGTMGLNVTTPHDCVIVDRGWRDDQ